MNVEVEIKVNVLELASELAHSDIINIFGDDPETLYIEDEDSYVYREEVQYEFNDRYDTYYDIIMSSEL